MIVGHSFHNLEVDTHLAVERVPSRGTEPRAGPRRRAGSGRKERPTAASRALFRRHPSLRWRAGPTGQSRRRCSRVGPSFPKRGGHTRIENVARDPGHGSRAPISAVSRSAVIFRCSSTAIASSPSGEFFILAWISARKLLAASSGGAHQVDPAEALFVRLVGQCQPRASRGTRGTALLALGPGSGGQHSLARRPGARRFSGDA